MQKSDRQRNNLWYLSSLKGVTRNVGGGEKKEEGERHGGHVFYTLITFCNMKNSNLFKMLRNRNMCFT